MSTAREALDAAALAAAALPPAVGPPPVPVPPRPDVAAAAERAILERAAAYQRAMSEEASGPSAPGSAGSMSSTSVSARRNPRLDEWTAEVARERREVERKMLLRESERAARKALEDQWSAFLERDVEPSDEFLARLARQHRERANEVERLKSDASRSPPSGFERNWTRPRRGTRLSASCWAGCTTRRARWPRRTRTRGRRRRRRGG